MNSKQLNLFSLQRTLLSQIIQPPLKPSPDWKILILDQPSVLLLQTHYSIKDLRQNLFTLQLLIHQKRPPLPGITAVYFLQATESNISLIIKDAKQDLYSTVEIHFLCDPGNDLLPILAESLAKQAPKFAKSIKKIDYVNINFYPIDHGIAIAPTFSQLASVISVLEYPPVFIYDPEEEGGVEMTRKKLLGQKHSIEAEGSQYCTAVIVVNRRMDYQPVLQFDNTFSGLAIDNCEIKGMNKLKIAGQTITLDAKNDFWVRNKFGNVMDIVTESQNQLNIMISKTQATKAVGGDNTVSKQKQFKIDTSMFENENEYNKLKSNFEFISAVITSASNRSIPRFLDFDVRNLNIKEVTEFLKFPKSDNSAILDEDKLRFVLTYIIANDKHPKLEELQKLISKVEKPRVYQEIRNSKVAGGREGVGNMFSQKSKDMLIGMFKSFVGSSKTMSVLARIVTGVMKGVGEIKQGSNLKIVEEKNWRKVKKVVVYVVGGISYLEYREIKECTEGAGVQFVYVGDKIAKASELLRD